MSICYITNFINKVFRHVKDNIVYHEKFQKKQCQNVLKKILSIQAYLRVKIKDSAKYFFKNKVKQTSEMYIIKTTKSISQLVRQNQRPRRWDTLNPSAEH